MKREIADMRKSVGKSDKIKETVEVLISSNDLFTQIPRISYSRRTKRAIDEN